MKTTLQRLTEGYTFRGNIFTALVQQLLLVLMLLSLCRIGFFLFNINFFPRMTFGHFTRLMWGGVRFDIVALLYFNILYIFLSIIPFDWRFHKGYRLVLRWLFYITNGSMLAINVCDFIYYKFTLRRTTADVFRQFRNEANIDVLWIRFLIDYWYALAFWILLMVVLVLVYRRITVSGPQLKSRLSYYLFTISAIPLTAILVWAGIRGGFRHSTRPITLSNAGEYVKDPKDINIVLNTPFSILRTIGKTNMEEATYYTAEEVEKIYSPLHRPADSLEFRPDNVVVIVLESFSKEFFGAVNRDGYTPFLDSLIRHSLTYEYSFANGRKSIDGLPSVISSIPSLGIPYFLSPYSGNKINSLPSLLKQKRYHTSFFHGAPNGSMGFEAFMNMAGSDHYFGMSEYNNDDDFDGVWGIWDDKFLDFYADKLNSFPQPFMSSFFSVSSHHPFAIPDEYAGKFNGGPLVIHKCIEYTDYSLRKFFQKASSMPWFNNTLFVITADHTSSEIEFPEGRTDWGFYSVPIIFYKPDNSLAGKRKEILQQIDIMPTVLGYLNFDSPYVAFGRDASGPGEKPFALNYKDNVYQYFEGDYLLQFDGAAAVAFYNFKTDRFLKKNIISGNRSLAAPMEERLKGIIQQYNNRIIHDNLTTGKEQGL